MVEFRQGTWQYNGDGKDLVSSTANFGDVVDIKLRPGADLAGFADTGVLVYKDAAKSNNLKVGQQLPMRFSATGTKQIPIRGIYDDNQGLGVFFSSYILSLKDYEANYTTQLDQAAGVKKPPSMSAAAARSALDAALAPFPNVDVRDNAQAKEAQLANFNTIINLMGALLLLAILIALIGIVNTLALSIYERTRELGLLRAVGMTRRQMRRMVRNEAVIIAVFGTLMGVVVGLLFGRAIVASLHNEGIVFSVPAAQIVVFIVLAALAGLSTPGGDVTGALNWGHPLLLGAVLLAALRLLRLGRVPTGVWVALAGAATFWFLAAFNKGIAWFAKRLLLHMPKSANSMRRSNGKKRP